MSRETFPLAARHKMTVRYTDKQRGRWFMAATAYGYSSLAIFAAACTDAMAERIIRQEKRRVARAEAEEKAMQQGET